MNDPTPGTTPDIPPESPPDISPDPDPSATDVSDAITPPVYDIWKAIASDTTTNRAPERSGEDLPVWADPNRVLRKVAGTYKVAERKLLKEIENLSPYHPRYEVLVERLRGRIDAYRAAIADLHVAAYAVGHARARDQREALNKPPTASATPNSTASTTAGSNEDKDSG